MFIFFVNKQVRENQNDEFKRNNLYCTTYYIREEKNIKRKEKSIDQSLISPDLFVAIMSVIFFIYLFGFRHLSFT